MKQKLERYKELIEEIETLKAQGDKCWAEKQDLTEEFQKYVIENRLYADMKELEQYEGYDIESIDLVGEVDGKVSIYHLWNDEIMDIREGKLYYSSYENGILMWNEEKGSYEYALYGNCSNINILGFFNLRLDSFYKKPYNMYKTIDVINKFLKEKNNEI